MNRKTFQALARLRLAEAKTLLDAGHFAGAYYLAGYVIECGLKACVAKKTNRFDFPLDKKALENVYTHDIRRLASGANLETKLKDAQSADSTFGQYWALVVQWSEVKRYELADEKTARDMLTAVGHTKHGVFRWIRKHW